MLWLLFIALEIGRNYWIIEKWKQRPRYDLAVVFRFGVGAAFFLCRHPEFDPLGDPSTIWPALVYFVFQFSSFHLLFDLILNLLRGKAWDYRGKNSGAYFDKGSWARYYTWKVASLLGLIVSIYLIWL